MTVISTPAQPAVAVVEKPLLSAVEVEASCRGPVLFLFFSSALWLLLGGLFGFIGSLKFHAPYFLADTPALTYGRVAPVRTNILLYGFALQSGLAVALWLLCRLGRARLALPGLALGGAVLWNIGTLAGFLGILAGGSTGFEYLEFPRYTPPILFVGFLMVGMSALFTFHNRTAEKLYPSQWFIVAALFWFSWAYFTATFFLLCSPVRGMAQGAVNWWFMNNFGTIVLGFFGISTLLYFIPKLNGTALYSRHLASLAFWVLLFFASWGGIHTGAPLPAWLPAMSTIGVILSSVGVMALAVNFFFTAQSDKKSSAPDLVHPFFKWGAVCFVLASALGIIGAMRNVNEFVYFTWYLPGHFNLSIFGFFGLTIAGAICYIVPRLTNCPSLPFTRGIFLSLLIGTALLFLPLAFAGVLQGAGMNNSFEPYLNVVRRSLIWFRMSTFGEVFVLAAGAMLALGIFNSVRDCAMQQFGISRTVAKGKVRK